MKDAPSGAVLEAARRIVALAAGHALVIVNDRADLALLAGADGVHLGDEDLPPAEARRLVGPDLLVGRTCRTLDEARAALPRGRPRRFGPIFPSALEALAVAPRGVAALAEVTRRCPRRSWPSAASTASNARDVARAGRPAPR